MPSAISTPQDILRSVVGVLLTTGVLLGLAVPLATSASAATPPRSALGERTGYAVGGNLQDRSDAELARELDLVAASGAKWVRLDVNWASTERVRGVRDWAPMDRVVTAITARGLAVLGLVTYAPSWARPAGSAVHAPPSDVTAFADFARAAAVRYTPRGITAWEVWNEPNIHNFWSPAPDAAQYVALLKATAAAVRSVNPSATIVSGGLSPATTSTDGRTVAPLEFVKRMYDLGAASSFSAVGWHPYSFPHMPTTPNTSSWNAYAQMPLVRDEMVRRGDGGKEVWLTEVGAPTGTAADAVSEQRQAEIVVEAVRTAGSWSWAGPSFVYAVRDAGTLPSDREQNFGLVRRDYSPKPAYGALRTLLAPTAPAAAPLPVTAPVTAPADRIAIPHTGLLASPLPPQSVTATGGAGVIAVRWSSSTTEGVVGHHVFRTAQAPGTAGRSWTRMTSYPLTGAHHNDRALRSGVRYWYRLTAVTSAPATVASGPSAEGSAVATLLRRRGGALTTLRG